MASPELRGKDIRNEKRVYWLVAEMGAEGTNSVCNHWEVDM